MGKAAIRKIAITIRPVILIAPNEKRVGIFYCIVQALRFCISGKRYKRGVGNIGQASFLHCAISKGDFDFIKHFSNPLFVKCDYCEKSTSLTRLYINKVIETQKTRETIL